MKKKIITASVVALMPVLAFAATPDQCALNSTCSFSIHGKFNKELITSDLQSGETYVCRVIRGRGRLLSVQNVYASKGVAYDLKGVRLNKAFVIHGPYRGTGYIRYTLHNNNDPWRVDSFQFKCVTAN
ncbi:MAG: hypothetical protein KDH94_01255 [Coxiellaceae bacterium]|nr:hypothetical protein [Coxiellaceae bacterium]